MLAISAGVVHCKVSEIMRILHTLLNSNYFCILYSCCTNQIYSE